MSQATTAPAQRWAPGIDTEPPTGTADYAALNGVFFALFAVLAYRFSDRWHETQPVEPRELPAVGLATFAMAKVVSKEKVGTWIREPFVEETPDHRPRKPAGRGMRYAVGELVTCSRCVGAWSALGLVSVRTANPPIGRALTGVLALSAINDFLQAGFRWICNTADQPSSSAG